MNSISYIRNFETGRMLFRVLTPSCPWKKCRRNSIVVWDLLLVFFIVITPPLLLSTPTMMKMMTTKMVHQYSPSQYLWTTSPTTTDVSTLSPKNSTPNFPTPLMNTTPTCNKHCCWETHNCPRVRVSQLVTELDNQTSMFFYHFSSRYNVLFYRSVANLHCSAIRWRYCQSTHHG